MSKNEIANITQSHGKQEVKSRKFVRALGLQPLLTMDTNELVKEGMGTGVVECPYTDTAYGIDAVRTTNGGGGIGGMPSGMRPATMQGVAKAKSGSGMTDTSSAQSLIIARA